MSRFDPDSYLRYRIEYPKELFSPLASFVCLRSSPFRVLDLGAGTGLSTQSFLSFFSEVDTATLVDPDPEMLACVQSWKNDVKAEIRLQVGRGETFSVKESVDLVLVGSAWHWMSHETTLSGIRNALKPGGAFFVFEYQFPKAKEGLDGDRINEWIRRNFNLSWKEVDQRPRGSFDELLAVVRAHGEFSGRGECRMEREIGLTVEDLFGLILSQSRYLAYERSLDPNQISNFRATLFTELCQVWGSAPSLPFVYRFHGVRFQTRSV